MLAYVVEVATDRDEPAYRLPRDSPSPTEAEPLAVASCAARECIRSLLVRSRLIRRLASSISLHLASSSRCRLKRRATSSGSVPVFLASRSALRRTALSTAFSMRRSRLAFAASASDDSVRRLLPLPLPPKDFRRRRVGVSEVSSPLLAAAAEKDAG